MREGRVRLSDRLSRRIDKSLVRGQFHVIGLLAVAAFVVAVVSALTMWALHSIPADEGSDPRPVAAFWQALVRTIDPGQITTDRGITAVIGLVTTIIGLLLLSTLISIVNNQVERRVDRVKRGRDPVRVHRVRKGGAEPVPYYVVLGWTELTLRLLEELAQSHIPGQYPEVLVMAPVAYADMVEQIDEYRIEVTLEVGSAVARTRQRLPSNRDWPHVRTGVPTDTRDLTRVAAVAEADAVIVLAPDEIDASTVDVRMLDELSPATAEVLKTVMAVSACVPHPVAGGGGSRSLRTDPSRPPTLVVEMPDSIGTDAGLARRIDQRLNDTHIDLILVDAVSTQARIAAHVSRTAGLAEVHRELLSFNGADFHIVDSASGVATFGDAVARMSNGIIVGTVGLDGEVDLWPEWDDPLDGKRLVSVQQDATGSVFDADFEPERGRRPSGAGSSESPEEVVIIGWNRRAGAIVESLDHMLSTGSTVRVFAPAHGVQVPELDLPNLGRPLVTTLEDGIQEWLDGQPVELDCDHAIVLSDDRFPRAVSDANVLLTLLALRPPEETRPKPDTVVAELRQRPNRHLASQRFSDDLVVGDSIMAMLLAQYASDPALAGVVEEIFGPLGRHRVEIRFVPFHAVIDVDDMDRSFRSLQQVVRRSDGSILLGYRITGAPDGFGRRPPGKLHLDPPGHSPVPHPEDAEVELVVFTRCEQCRPAARASPTGP